jgi:hypothetical protein
MSDPRDPREPRDYQVTDVHGTVHPVTAHWVFNNNGALTFRYGERGSSEVVAEFAAGQWTAMIRERDLPDG